MADKNLQQLPPQSAEAEKSVLGALMIDKNAVYKVADFLLPKDFYKKSHQEIYITILELFEKGEPIDLLSVSGKLKAKKILEESGGNSYLTDLINTVPTASHVMSYARTVHTKRILRDLIETSQAINEMGYQENEDIEILLDKAEQKIFSIAQGSLTQAFTPVKSLLEETFERIDNLSKQKEGVRGVRTGFKDLDNILSGLQKSDLVILASRPSMGKSSLALNMALNIASQEKIPVGLFSLEMSKDQLVDRLISSVSNVDLWKLRTGRLSHDEGDNDFERIQHAMGILSESPIFIDDASTPNILQMKAMARRLQAEHGLGLIIVDYLQLMESRGLTESLVQQVSEISRSLKGMARELNIPVLALSQLSRAVEHRTPQIPRLADLRESGCLTGDSLITRADTGERIAIKDLVGKTDIPVHSLDNNLKIKEMKISKVFCSGEKMVYELKTRSGFSIKASANHPFRKLNSWEKMDNLSIGDFIACPRNLNLSNPKNSLKEEEIILIAHLIGDGCVLKKQPIHYTSSDFENIKIVGKTAEKLFNIKPRIIKQKNWWHIYLPTPYRLARNKHHPIINWYRKMNISPVRSYEKEIPQEIFSLNQENLCLFLKHLWATDGNISYKILKGRKTSGNIYYSTTSYKLAKGVKHVLLMLGIRCVISEAKKENYRICYHIRIQGKKDQLMFLNNIGSYGKRGEIVPQLINCLNEIEENTNLDVIPKEIWPRIGIFKDEYNLSWRGWAENYGMSFCGSTLFKHGVSRQRLASIVKFMPELELKNLSESDVFWDQIVSINPLGIEQVYDATVPETHNFISNDIILHNSLEQDADVVLFIYREDRYREDTEKKNIAEIIIAKHRNGPIGKINLYFDEQRASFRNLEKTEMKEEGQGEYATDSI